MTDGWWQRHRTIINTVYSGNDKDFCSRGPRIHRPRSFPLIMLIDVLVSIYMYPDVIVESHFVWTNKKWKCLRSPRSNLLLGICFTHVQHWAGATYECSTRMQRADMQRNHYDGSPALHTALTCTRSEWTLVHKTYDIGQNDLIPGLLRSLGPGIPWS